MNEATVGLENLPNVFIDKIIIDPETTTGAGFRPRPNVKVMIKIYDHADNHSWRNKVRGLKVKCAFVDDDKISQLNNGTISLYDIPFRQNKVMAVMCDSLRFADRRDGYETYTGIFELKSFNVSDNLNVYVACFIDDLEFGIPQFDKFYGPMAAERILIGGIPNTTTNYFYDPETNEEYGGPVHLSPNGYMEGSEHRSEPHRTLRLVQEENFKLVVGSNAENGVYAGFDFSKEEEVISTQTGVPTGVPQPDGPPAASTFSDENIEDPNVPTDPLTEIYE